MVLEHELALCRRGGLIIPSDLISRPRDIDRHRLPRPGRLAIALESAYRRRFAWRLADGDLIAVVGVQAGCMNGGRVFGNASQSQTSSTGFIDGASSGSRRGKHVVPWSLTLNIYLSS